MCYPPEFPVGKVSAHYSVSTNSKPVTGWFSKGLDSILPYRIPQTVFLENDRRRSCWLPAVVSGRASLAPSFTYPCPTHPPRLFQYISS